MPSAVVIGKAIPVKLLKLPTIRGQLAAATKRAERDLKTGLELTVATWHHEVAFHSYAKYRGGDIVVAAWTTDRPWNYLNDGTRIRYATMTPDFVAKTIPRVVGSFQGQGGLAYVNRNRPRRGIQAREWTKMLVDIYSRRLGELVGVAISKGLKG
jgi:hypothetical protein